MLGVGRYLCIVNTFISGMCVLFWGCSSKQPVRIIQPEIKPKIRHDAKYAKLILQGNYTELVKLSARNHDSAMMVDSSTVRYWNRIARLLQGQALPLLDSLGLNAEVHRAHWKQLSAKVKYELIEELCHALGQQTALGFAVQETNKQISSQNIQLQREYKQLHRDKEAMEVLLKKLEKIR